MWVVQKAKERGRQLSNTNVRKWIGRTFFPAFENHAAAELQPAADRRPQTHDEELNRKRGPAKWTLDKQVPPSVQFRS